MLAAPLSESQQNLLEIKQNLSLTTKYHSWLKTYFWSQRKMICVWVHLHSVLNINTLILSPTQVIMQRTVFY